MRRIAEDADLRQNLVLGARHPDTIDMTAARYLDLIETLRSGTCRSSLRGTIMSIMTKVSAQAPIQPNAVPQQDNAQAKKLEPTKGRVDAIDDGRLFGWAFDPAAPGKRLTIRVLLDGKPIAEASPTRTARI